MLGDMVVINSNYSIVWKNSNKNKSNDNWLNTNNLSFGIMTSYTNKARKPQIEFGMHCDYENGTENDNKSMQHKSMNTRITHNDISMNHISDSEQLNDTNVSNINESHTSQNLLLSNNNNENINLTIDMNNEEYVTIDESKLYSNSTSTSSLNSQRSHSHSRYNINDIVQFKHHIISDLLTFTNDIISQ